MSPATAELEALLSSLFEAEELRRFLRRLPHGEALVATLPGEGCSKADLVHKARLALERRGMVDEDIFAALRVEFPKRLADIDAVAAQRAPAARHARPRGPDQAPDRAGGVHIHGGTFHNVQILQGERGRQEQRVEVRAAPPESSSRRSRGEVARRAGGGPLPTWDPVRILHLSDLHFHEKTQWDAGTVLGALAEDVKNLQASVGPIDLVVLTGDLAFAGKVEEYALAESWLTEKLAPAAGVSKDRIRMVPGNHDVDRKQISRMVRASDADMVATGDDAIAEILADAPQRAQILARQSAYRAFAARFHPDLNAPWWTHTLSLGDLTLRLIGLNTAWLAGSHLDRDNRVQDQRHLLIGGPQWNALFASADPADLCIALMHHPWDDLAERDQRALEEATLARCGVVLRGHLHDSRAIATQADDLDVLQLAAGACYADPRDGWPHGYQLLELDPRLGQARIHLRKWHGRERTWIPDKERYRKAAPEGILSRPLRRSPRFPAPPPPVPDDHEDTTDHPTDPPPAAPSGPPSRAPFDLYKSMLQDRADTLPTIFQLHGDHTALSKVFVKVEVSSRVASLHCDDEAAFASAHREMKHLLADGRGGLPERPFLLEEVASRPGARWAVLGDPGSGKTTLLRHAALTLLRPDGPLPVYLRVEELRPDLPETLGRAYTAECRDWLHQAIRRGRAVILVDGLDEAADRAAANTALQQLGAQAGDCPVVVASRPIGFAPPWRDTVTLAICPLGPTEQRDLLSRWLKGDTARADRELERLSRAPRLRRLAENPLMLTLAGLVLREGGSLPRRRGELYEQVIDALLKRSASVDGAPRSLRAPIEARSLLSRAALALHGREGDLYRTHELVEVFNADPRLQATLQRCWGDASSFLAEVAERTGLLVPERRGAVVQGYTFPHRTFREFLAACALEADLGGQAVGLQTARAAPVVPPPTAPEGRAAPSSGPEGWWAWLWRWLLAALGAPQRPRLEVVAPAPPLPPAPPPTAPAAPGELGRVLLEAKARPDLWAEVLALTCGRLGPGGADALVRRIAAEESTPLLLRVVADAEGITATTVQEVLKLESGWDKWEARKKVLEEIPALVGDPGVAVGLIEQFVRTTWDGNDLFWAREVLLGVTRLEGAQHEDARRAAASVIGGIFEHFPAERLEEARAILAKLWRPIPAGSFRMGSPDGEGHDDEHPQHKVTFKSGFQMMSVPVTWRLYELFNPGHKEARDSFEGLPKDQHAEAPVYNVTWFASTMFAAWVGARLPLEAEWEYACRAGTTTPYWSGKTEADLDRVGWTRRNSGDRPHKVAELPANPWGLHDMHGNVWEWCLDVWDSDAYAARRAGVLVEPAGDDEGRLRPAAAVAAPMITIGGDRRPAADLAAEGGGYRVVRGGSWGSVPSRARSAYRDSGGPRYRDLFLGFRLVLPDSSQR